MSYDKKMIVKQLTGEITHEQYLYLHENKNLYNLIIQIYKCITSNFFACSSVVIIIASHVAKYNNIIIYRKIDKI